MTELAPREPLSLLAVLQEAGGLTETGLHLNNPDLTYDQYEALCVWLGRAHEAVRFAIGDAIRLGEQLFGDKAYQAIEMIHLSEKGRLEYVRVAERVPRSVRRKDLSWSHHRAVAALPVPEQKRWLKKAAVEGMSHSALRDDLRNGHETAKPTTCRCCGRDLDAS